MNQVLLLRLLCKYWRQCYDMYHPFKSVLQALQNYTAPFSFRFVPNPYVFLLLRQTRVIKKTSVHQYTNLIASGHSLYGQLYDMFNSWQLEGESLWTKCKVKWASYDLYKNLWSASKSSYIRTRGKQRYYKQVSYKVYKLPWRVSKSL